MIAFTWACKPTQLVTKSAAIHSVKLAGVDNWKEAISDEGRFRVLFPDTPRRREDLSTLKGFSLVEPSTSWTAYYLDYAVPRESDDTTLRTAYVGSIATIVKNSQAQL